VGVLLGGKSCRWGRAPGVVGGSLKDAQAQLGHTKLSTTLEIYTVPIPAHQRAAVGRLSDLLTNVDKKQQLEEKASASLQPIQ
jgi:hypothetical protein